MAVFKCKMCGGELDIQEGQVIATCDYCGTKQTVPTACSEELRTLYNRANVLRMKSEFDKAEQVYERIITADPKQAEAYWGALLCKYGIEYVEDPKTYKRIPTCHRVSYEAMEADEYYKLAIENADSVQRKIYEEEAKYIDGVQKDILALSAKEDSFDVFLCYKETDESGKRTRDSVIANDIYHQLTQEGYKVFYAAITLEDKLGSAYEPVIFAALNSAKVMLVIGTKPEYFNAVWVKNEWSRFLKLMKTDHSKLLIPCYQDMDAYELPEEFAHLQAQDMAKIGFISDIVRGIKKVIVKEDTDHHARAAEKSEQSAGSSAAPLLKRAYMFAQDEDWENASQYAERVLDIDPENAEAYLVKLLCDLKMPNVEALSASEVFFVENSNYKKAQRFADEKTNALLKDSIYSIAKRQIEKNDLQEINDGLNMFKSISGWKDSNNFILESEQRVAELATEAREKLEQCRGRASTISNLISTSLGHVVGLKTDGTVVAADNFASSAAYAGRCNVTTWKNIVQVVASEEYTAGLRDDGSVVVALAGRADNRNVPHWTDMIKIVAGTNSMLGLKSDGTVVRWTSQKDSYSSDDVLKGTAICQRNIKEVCSEYTGIAMDGRPALWGIAIDSVVASHIAKWQDLVYFGYISRYELVDNVKQLIQMCIGVKADGRLLVIDAMGRTEKDYEFWKWENIVTVRADYHLVVGLRSDGSIVACPFEDVNVKERTQLEEDWKKDQEERRRYICKDISTWKDIVAIDKCLDVIVGVKKDGTVVASGVQNLAKDWKLFNDANHIQEELAEQRLIAEENRAKEIRKSEEAKRQVAERRRSLLAERNALNQELSTLGIFAFKRKREIQTRLWQIDEELGKL